MRRWSRRMTLFYKILNRMTPPYLVVHLPEHRVNNASLRNNVIRPPLSRAGRYDNSFFHFVLIIGTLGMIPSNSCLL